MTIRLTDQGLTEAIEVAVWTGSVIVLLVVGLIVYLMVRPPRRLRVEREPEAIDGEEMLRLMDRMERRLEVLERALAEKDEQGILEAGAETPRTRRVK